MDTSTTLKEGYKILDLVTKTPYGYNYRAQDLKTSRTVLLKIFTQRSQTSAQDFQSAKEAIKQEAALLHGLNHPQIAAYQRYFKVTDSSDSIPREYRTLVQCWVNGESYGNHLQRSPYSESQVIQFLQSILSVLTTIHDHSPPIIHGNLHPEHIIQGPENQPILINFGSPQRALAQLAQSPILQSIGSHPIFSPPEQRKGKPLTPSTDLYSLAVTALCLLTGQPNPTCLYDEVNQHWQWQQYLPTEVTRLNPAFIAILDRMLDPDPDRRYASAQAVYLALLNLDVTPIVEIEDYVVDHPIYQVDYIVPPPPLSEAVTPHQSSKPTPQSPPPKNNSPKQTSPKPAQPRSSSDRKISNGDTTPVPEPDQYMWTGPMAPIGKMWPILDFSIRKILTPCVLALSAFGLLKGGYDHLTQRQGPTAKECMKGIEERRRIIGFRDEEVDKRFNVNVPNAPAFLNLENPNHEYYIQQWCFTAHAVMDDKITGSTPTPMP
jgi:serine/threonine protein kinase